MKYLMNRIGWLAMVLLSINMAVAQIQAPVIKPAYMPDHFIAAGAGFNQAPSPQINGWISLGVKVTDSVYSYTTTEFTKLNSTVRTGIATVVYQGQGMSLLAIGDAGMTTSATTDVGGSFSFGGIVAYDISQRFLKIPNTHLMASFRPIKNNTSEANGGGFHTAFQFGIAKTF